MIPILNVPINYIDIVDIFIMSIILYHFFLLIRGTRAVHVTFGLATILIVSLFSELLKLQTISWLLSSNFFQIWILTIIIIYQDELRKALTRLGSNKFWQKLFYQMVPEDYKDLIIKSVNRLSKRREGGLIVIENSIGLKNYIETGIYVNADITTELLTTIFYKNTPLHDGAVIIKGNKIVAAGCILPLSEKTGLKKSYGTRHRAALGLSEESDALIIAVSEETGKISVAYKGELASDIDENLLLEMMTMYIK